MVFNSGTSALHGAYFAINLGHEEKLVTSPITFAATSNAALYLGAKPIFCDIESATGNINPSLIQVPKNVKAIVPVHYAGNPVDLKSVYDLAHENDLYVIEDAAHAVGANYNDHIIGSCKYSDMTVFSFHPVKHITTGEGGAVLTNNPDFYDKMLKFRSHGINKDKFQFQPHGDWYYEMQFLGHNYRMTDIQAALGLSQLNKLKEFVKRRRKIARIYEELFEGNHYFDTIDCINQESSYHLFPILLKDPYKCKKSNIFIKLREKGLGVQVHYIPVYLQPYYEDLGYKAGSCPVAEDFYHREISIPIYPAMSDDDVNYVVETIYEIFHKL